MKKLIVLIIVIVIPFISFSQDSKEQDTCHTFYAVEQMPEYPGGTNALLQYIADNIHYPQTAKENNIQGKVFVNFIVDETGQVTNVRVVKTVETLLDAEAVRVIKSLPLWKPGMQKGKTVRVQFTIPINFALYSTNKELKKLKKQQAAGSGSKSE
jgi:TonB family protein